MTIETRIRKLLASKLALRRKRGPFCVIEANGKLTDHKTKKAALNYLLAKVRCMNSLRWEIKWRTKAK